MNMSGPSQFNLSGANFRGPTQMGNNNQQFITRLNGQAIATHEAAQLKSLLEQLHTAIHSTTAISTLAKKDAAGDLAKVLEELSKPEQTRERSIVEHYWGRMMSVVKDVGSVCDVATKLAGMLGIT